MAHRAADHRTGDAVVAGDVAGDAADDRALEAALGLRGHGADGQGGGERGDEDEWRCAT